jgi:hypothetical protein
MQKDIITVTDVEAARALRGVGFLPQFLEPASPSDVAKLFKVAANLVHHHAKRCLELGLLFEAKREGGKVFYQTAARNFRFPRGLLEPDETLGFTLRQLSGAFMKAFEKSARLYTKADYEYEVYGFEDYQPEQEPEIPNVGSDEPRPAHFQAITVRLSPSSYRELIVKLSQLINEAKAETENSVACTIGLVGFEGILEDVVGEFETQSLHMQSFVPGVRIAPFDQEST